MRAEGLLLRLGLFVRLRLANELRLGASRFARRGGAFIARLRRADRQHRVAAAVEHLDPGRDREVADVDRSTDVDVGDIDFDAARDVRRIDAALELLRDLRRMPALRRTPMDVPVITIGMLTVTNSPATSSWKSTWMMARLTG